MRQILESVDGISSVDDVGQLQALEKAIESYFASPDAARHLAVWFRLFERFPEDDGYEVFWSALHGIEAQPGYEPLAVESVRRRPSRFPPLMVNRMLNAGQAEAGGTDLLALLRSVAADLPAERSGGRGPLRPLSKRACLTRRCGGRGGRDCRSAGGSRNRPPATEPGVRPVDPND